MRLLTGQDIFKYCVERLAKPGDIFLFDRQGFFNYAIKIKTWSPVSHSEIYIGNGKTIGSRNGIGVGTYDIKLDGLAYILRPINEPDMDTMLAWHNKQIGQKYDWFGILRFFTLGKPSLDKQFCSEHNARAYMTQNNVRLFSSKWDSDLISPGDFLKSPSLEMVWEHNRNEN